jgi:hypothetical protein
LGMNLVSACGLTSEEFLKMLNTVVTLRNNLLESVKKRE